MIVVRYHDGRVWFEPCGAPHTQMVKIGGDYMFYVCSRHNNRLARAGVKQGRR